MNLRQSKEFAQYLKSIGWSVEKIDSNYAYWRRISFLPPLILKIPYPTPPIPFAQIEKLIQKYRPLKIEIQPQKTESGLKKYGYKLCPRPAHLTKTLQIDLTQPEKEILAQMKKDGRYCLRKARKENLQIRSSDGVSGLEKFYLAWKKAVGWRRWVPSLKSLKALKKAFNQKSHFLIATTTTQPSSSQEKIIAGTVILKTNQTAYYYSAFSSKEGRKKLSQYLLVWEAIKLAKKQGCKTFDFEGLYDPRFPIKSWRGFTHFKKSFGGQEVNYPGCFVKYCFPF